MNQFASPVVQEHFFRHLSVCFCYLVFHYTPSLTIPSAGCVCCFLIAAKQKLRLLLAFSWFFLFISSQVLVPLIEGYLRAANRNGSKLYRFLLKN